MKRDFTLKPRTFGDLPPEKLEQILSRIYTEETVDKLMDRLFGPKQPAEEDNQ